MRIAFIAPFGMQPKGTVSARMVPLAEALAGRGHRVRLVVPAWDDPQARAEGSIHLYTYAPGRSGSASAAHIVRRIPRALPDGLALPLTLVREARRFRPDVYHVFKPTGYSGLAGLLLATARSPWVLDVDDWEGPGGWVDVNPYAPWQKAAITLLEALLPRLARAVTAASRALEARAWDFGLPRSRVFYLPNGVSTGKYGSWAAQARAAGGSGEARAGRPTILLYTRFAEFPFWWPLDVLRAVLRDHPGARLLVVGRGFSGEEERLRGEAARMGLEEHVEVTGRVPEAALPALLGSTTVALYPMTDNLINRAKSPVKVLEPMVLGLPIVGHRVGQAAEFVGDGGVLVPPGQLEQMSRAVSALLSDPAERARLGELARERVWSRFNWESLCLQAEEAYRVALDR